MPALIRHSLMTSIVTLVMISLIACNSPPANPSEDPPEPQASSPNILRDTIKAPIDKAKSIEDTMSANVDDALNAADAAVNGEAGQEQ